MGKTTRVATVDIMKGICIIMVVVQHCHVLPDVWTSSFTSIYFSFNMPLFFFLSGLFLPSHRTAREVVAGGWRRLLLPWVVFALLGGLIVDIAVGSRYGRLSPHGVYLWLVSKPNVPLYFLRALFVATVGCWALSRLCGTQRQRMAALGVLCALSWAAFRLSPEPEVLPLFFRGIFGALALRQACATAMFMWLGHMVACSVAPAAMKMRPAVAVAVFAGAIAAAWLVGPMPVWWHAVVASGPWSRIVVSAMCGILAMWALGSLLERCRPLALAGRFSLPVLVVHYIILMASVELLGITRQQALPIVVALTPLAAWACVRWLPWACARPASRKLTQ